MPDRVHIFWDNSNIFIGSKYAAQRREAGFAWQNVRVQFDNVLALARGGRTLTAAICVGSVPPELRTVWDRLRDLGVTVETYERGAGSGTEQGTDQCLQVHMLRARVDVCPPAGRRPPHRQRRALRGGRRLLRRPRADGEGRLGVGVISWDGACKRAFKDWAGKVGCSSRSRTTTTPSPSYKVVGTPSRSRSCTGRDPLPGGGRCDRGHDADGPVVVGPVHPIAQGWYAGDAFLTQRMGKN